MILLCIITAITSAVLVSLFMILGLSIIVLYSIVLGHDPSFLGYLCICAICVSIFIAYLDDISTGVENE